jgi:hypothetical protein
LAPEVTVPVVVVRPLLTLLTVLFVALVMASRVAAPADVGLLCGFMVGEGGFAG